MQYLQNNVPDSPMAALSAGKKSLADIQRGVQHALSEKRAAAERGVFIDTGAADDVRNYWGHSFWLFLAATLASTFGAMFAC